MNIWNDQSRSVVSAAQKPLYIGRTNNSSFDNPPPLSAKYNRRMEISEEFKSGEPELESLQMFKEKDDDVMLQPIKSVNTSNHSINVYKRTTITKPTLYNQVLTALSVSLVSLIVGFVSGYTSPASESMKKELLITDTEVSWVGGLVPLGALVGGLAGGQMIERMGRKSTLLFTNIFFMVSWIIIAIAPNEWYIYVGRCIAGFCVGVASLVMPVYLGETIQPEVRGTLGLLPTAFGNIGILICFVAGTYLSWSNLAWLGVILPVPFLLLAFVIPETPRWFISKGKPQSAEHALSWLRGDAINVQEEFESLTNFQRESAENPKYNVKDLFKKGNVKPLFISLGLMFFQQMSGINAVIFYTADIFEMSGSNINKNLSTIIVGIVNFISTFIATVLIDRLGRKVLLYISSISMTVTLGTLGLYFYLVGSNTTGSEYGWLPLVSFVIYVLGFSLGFGPIPWLMLGEIFPARIKGSAAAFATAFNFSCAFIVTKTFVNIIHAIGPYGTFWMFGVICVISLVFIILWVPETRGQSLQEIERKLAGLPARRTSAITNLKQIPSEL